LPLPLLDGAAVSSQFERHVDGLTALPDAGPIWDRTAEFAYDLGFSSCSLTIARKSADGLQSTFFMSDLTHEFSNAYRNDGLVGVDPFLQFSCRSLSAKKVATDDLACFKGASAEHQAFLDQAAESGAVAGMGIPVRTPESEHFGGWLFSSREKREAFDLLDKDHGREAHLAGVLAYERMIAIGIGAMGQRLLSERERECLLWLCAGLRVSMIAEKLSISESAVNLYISNAKHKLGAKTREQAIARAIFSGEIDI
jgi:DNA-binding CsgD family transcriptional regulator